MSHLGHSSGGGAHRRLAAFWVLIVAAFLIAGCSSGPGPSVAPASQASRPAVSDAPASAAASPLASAGSTDSPIAVSGLAGRLLFYRGGGVYGEDTMFTAAANGSGERQISGLGKTCCARWSPGGSLLSYAATAADGKRISTAIVSPEGKTLRTLPLPGLKLNLGPPAWSPDGRTLAFEGFDDSDPSLNGIYLGRSSDAGGLRRLTTGNDLPGDFSPDGRQLVFWRPEPGSDSLGSLYVVSVDGSGLRQLTPPALPVGSSARWSPDGRLILFAEAGASSDGAVWAVAPDGSGMRRVFQDSQGRFAIDPTWSPDGSMIMFGLDQGPVADEYGANGLYVIRGDGSGLTLVLGDDTFKGGPDWVK